MVPTRQAPKPMPSRKMGSLRNRRNRLSQPESRSNLPRVPRGALGKRRRFNVNLAGAGHILRRRRAQLVRASLRVLGRRAGQPPHIVMIAEIGEGIAALCATGPGFLEMRLMLAGVRTVNVASAHPLSNSHVLHKGPLLNNRVRVGNAHLRVDVVGARITLMMN